MAMARGTFSPLLAPGLATIFFKKLKIRKTEYTQWINVKKSQRAYEDEYKMAGLGPFMQKGEGEVYSMDEALSGDTLRFTHLTYALGFRVTVEMLEDDLYGIMNKLSSELAKSASYNKDVQCASVLNNAFDSDYTGYNGIELCSIIQDDLDGGTQSNHAAAAVDMDLPAVQAALEAFESWTDDRSFIVDVKATWLVHATGDIWMAGELLESEFVPDSADNAKNIVRSKYGIKPMHLKHLTDTDAWFLVADKSGHDMKMYLRVNDQFKNSDDPLNGDAIFTARHRLSVGFGDWRGVWGSPGA